MKRQRSTTQQGGVPWKAARDQLRAATAAADVVVVVDEITRDYSSRGRA